MADVKNTKSNDKSSKRESVLLKNIKVKEGSAAEAAGWTNSTKTADKPRTNSIIPSYIKTKKEEVVENQSTKYPGLTIEEETQIDSNPALSTITRERAYKEMLGKKKEREWLDDRSNIRKQYISKQATTGSDDEDKALINMGRALDGVREEIINAGGKGVNKVTDMELINMIGETNPYTAKIINSVSKGDMTPEQATYFLLNGDDYKEAVAEYAKQNPAGEKSSTKKEKAGIFESFREGAFSAVKGAAKTAFKQGTNMMTDLMLAGPRAISFLATGKDITQPLKDIAGNVIDEAAANYDEQAIGDKKFNKRAYGGGKLLGEAGLMTAAGGLGKAALSDASYSLGTNVGTKLAASKYAPQIAKGIETLDKIGNTTGGKVGKWILNRAINGIEEGLTIQGVSDIVEGDLSSAKDYMSSIELATVLTALGDFVGLGFKKFANPGKKISEIVKGDGGLNSNQISQLENEVKIFNSTNKAENPFRTRAAEVKSQAIPKLEQDIKTIGDERDALTKVMVNDGNKNTKRYLKDLNDTLKNSDLGNITVNATKSGKLKVAGGTTAGSEAESQLKEFIDMINAQSDGGTKSLIDTIKAAKQIAKEAQIAGKSNKMTKAISEYSKMLEGEVEKLYPDVRSKVNEKNSELSELLGTKKKIIDLGDDYSALAGKMNSDTDFYNFMEELYKKGYTKEHFGNKTLGTYYTMGLRAPELLSEQAKLFYPSVPGLEEAGLKYLQKQAKQAYGGLGAIAGQETTTPVGAWSKMASDVYQLNKANNR